MRRPVLFKPAWRQTKMKYDGADDRGAEPDAGDGEPNHFAPLRKNSLSRVISCVHAGVHRNLEHERAATKRDEIATAGCRLCVFDPTQPVLDTRCANEGVWGTKKWKMSSIWRVIRREPPHAKAAAKEQNRRTSWPTDRFCDRSSFRSPRATNQPEYCLAATICERLAD